jgi:hypothetical protein
MFFLKNFIAKTTFDALYAYTYTRKVQVEFTQEEAMKAQWGSRGRAVVFL